MVIYAFFLMWIDSLSGEGAKPEVKAGHEEPPDRSLAREDL